MTLASWVCRALWYGGFGLALSGLVIISYITVSLFNLTDKEVDKAVQMHSEGRADMSLEIIASVGAMPIVLLLWSTAFVMAGLLILVFTVDYSQGALVNAVPMRRFRILASVPTFVGVAAVIWVVIVVEGALRRAGTSHVPRDR